MSLRAQAEVAGMWGSWWGCGGHSDSTVVMGLEDSRGLLDFPRLVLGTRGVRDGLPEAVTFMLGVKE